MLAEDPYRMLAEDPYRMLAEDPYRMAETLTGWPRPLQDGRDPYRSD